MRLHLKQEITLVEKQYPSKVQKVLDNMDERFLSSCKKVEKGLLLVTGVE